MQGKINKEEIKVPHPEYGHVIFTNPTSRQKDILLEYVKFFNRFTGTNIKPRKKK